MNLQFQNRDKEDADDLHQCKSKMEGDWILFDCSACSYQRKINWKTREMKVQEGEDPFIRHSGSHAPSVFQNDLYNPN